MKLSIAFGLSVLTSILVLVPSAFACKEPIEKQGSSCPIGYYSAGGYCIPFN